ncbi:MAG: type II secretion system protein [Candidatus Saccharimonadota bacterium]|jgi:prepilin-type N-terminal cleavage/methylation domain-containing protein
MKSTRGFTVIELLIVATLFAVASVVFFVQKNNFEVAARDEARKTSINALYYGLEEVYFKASNTYPRTISSEALPSVDPEQFKDPSGVKIGESDSDFRYESFDCSGDSCKSYTLRTTLENEDDFVKESRNN